MKSGQNPSQPSKPPRDRVQDGPTGLEMRFEQEIAKENPDFKPSFGQPAPPQKEKE